MTIDGFLTFLTLIIAAYAIVPPVTRLRIQMRRFWPALLSVLALGLVIYFEFFDLLGRRCPSALDRICTWITFTPQAAIEPRDAAFFVVLAWLALVWWLISRTHISPRALPSMARLVSQLAYEQRYAELIDLINGHIPLLDRVANRSLRRMKIHDVLKSLDTQPSWAQLTFSTAAGNPTIVRTRSVILLIRTTCKWLASRLAYLVPTGDRQTEAARDIARVILNGLEVTSHIVRYRPEFGLQLLNLSVPAVHDFFDRYFTALASTPGSAFFVEVNNNQNISSREGYYYAPHNPIVYYLLNDATKAEYLHAWKPVGDLLIARLRPENISYVEYLNGSAEGFDEEKWQDVTYVGLRFFDLMVRAAEYQGVRYHMWLYYLPEFVERLIGIYDASGPHIDHALEHPTRAAALVYEICDMLTSWIRSVRDLPDASPHREVETTAASHENSNIPKSAAIALGMCLHKLLVADNVDRGVKLSVYGMVMRGMRDLRGDPVADRFREVMINAVVQGGIHSYGTAEYGEALRDFFEDIDHVVRFDLDDYSAALSVKYA